MSITPSPHPQANTAAAAPTASTADTLADAVAWELNQIGLDSTDTGQGLISRARQIDDMVDPNQVAVLRLAVRGLDGELRMAMASLPASGLTQIYNDAIRARLAAMGRIMRSRTQAHANVEDW